MKLRDLPIGSTVRYNGAKYNGSVIDWVVVGKNHPGYPNDSVTLQTRMGYGTRKDGSRIAFDGQDDIYPTRGGNNATTANITQWLESDEINWYSPQYKGDRPPSKENVYLEKGYYDDEPGFLNEFSNDFKNILLPTKLKTKTKKSGERVWEWKDETRKVFLLDDAEVGLGKRLNNTVNKTLDYYRTEDAERYQKPDINGKVDSSWWLRGVWEPELPSNEDSHTLTVFKGRKALSSVYPYLNNNLLASPAINISGNLDVKYDGGDFTLIINQPPTLTLNTPQSQTVFENDNISIDGTAQDIDKGDVVIVKAKIADSRVINLATKVSDGKPFDFARTFLFKQGRVWQGNEPITSVLSDTSHKIEVWAEDDKGGKSKVEVRTFSTTANRPPIVKITKTPSLTNVTNSTPVEVAGTVSDPDGHDVTMTAKLNDSPQEEIAIAGGEWSYIIQPSDLKEGANEITIIARDEHGMSHTKTVRINNTIYKADMSHVPSVALFDVPLEGVESDGAVMWLRRQSDNTQFEARVATEGKKEEDFHEMQKTSHVVGNTPRDQFAGQTGVKTNNVTIEVTATGNHSLLMIQGVVK